MATNSCRIVGRFLAQETLAEQMGVSRQAVTKWEADQSAPSSEKLIALAKLFQISLDELIGNESVPANPAKKPNPILRTNLTRIAITLHAAFGYAARELAPLEVIIVGNVHYFVALYIAIVLGFDIRAARVKPLLQLLVYVHRACDSAL